MMLDDKAVEKEIDAIKERAKIATKHFGFVLHHAIGLKPSSEQMVIIFTDETQEERSESYSKIYNTFTALGVIYVIEIMEVHYTAEMHEERSNLKDFSGEAMAIFGFGHDFNYGYLVPFERTEEKEISFGAEITVGTHMVEVQRSHWDLLFKSRSN